MIRKPAVEGRFYGSDRASVFKMIEEMERKGTYADPANSSGTTIGGIVPHAGHVYSGWQTIPLFRQLLLREEVPETFVIINPNHTGFGEEIALDPHDEWENCIGSVQTDQEMASVLPYPADASAQRSEHSAEVIIPYLQYFFREYSFRILPVCMKAQSYENAVRLANDLHQAVQLKKRRVLIIASSDFSHFLTPEQGYRMDQMVLDRIGAKDAAGVDRVVRTNNISVCGFGPIMTLMKYAEHVDSNYTTEILARGHSGEVHSSREVVDYISIIYSIPG